MVSKPTPIIKILLICCIFIVVLLGGIALREDIAIKSVESKRVSTLDGYRYANDVAKRCVVLFQLDEVDKYSKARSSVYSYLSDDLKELYFPNSKIEGVNAPSKITITNTVSEKISEGYYMVKLEFTKEGRDYKNHKVFISIKNGYIVSIDTIL